MKRSREAGGDSTSGAKKQKPLAPPPLPPVVPLDSNFEVNWKNEFFSCRKIVPGVRDQGERQSCGLHVVLEATEMEDARAYALKGQPWRFKLDMKKWIVDFELNTGKLIENFEDNQLVRALCFARDKGIPVEGSENVMKITGFKYYKDMSFNQAAALLQEGRPIIGGFQYDENFGRMKGKEIYHLNKNKFNRRRGKQLKHHAVVFIGYGVRNREPYLVFLNSWGQIFCEDGFGRIHFLDVKDFFTITR